MPLNVWGVMITPFSKAHSGNVLGEEEVPRLSFRNSVFGRGGVLGTFKPKNVPKDSDGLRGPTRTEQREEKRRQQAAMASSIAALETALRERASVVLETGLKRRGLMFKRRGIEYKVQPTTLGGLAVGMHELAEKQGRRRKELPEAAEAAEASEAPEEASPGKEPDSAGEARTARRAKRGAARGSQICGIQ